MYNSSYFSRQLHQYIPPLHSGTSLLLGMSLSLTLLSPFLKDILVMDLDTIQTGGLWTIFTSPFILQQQSPFFLILLVLFCLYYMTGMVRGARFQAKPWLTALACFLVIALINSFLPQQLLWAWFTDFLLFAYLAYPIERKPNWGTRKFLIFSGMVLFGSYMIIAIYLLIFGTVDAHFIGMNPLHKAYLLAWSLSMGRRRLMWLNVQARSLRWFLLIFCILEFILFPLQYGLSGLLGLIIAWILLEDLWKKDRRLVAWNESKKDWRSFQRKWTQYKR